MKKRWGKPITQVQRFVPQEYAVICTSYNLKPTGLANDIKIDYNENERYDSGIGEGSLNRPAQNNVTPTQYKPVKEIEASSYPWYRALYNGFIDFTNTTYFESITAPSIAPLYYYDKAFYTGEKTTS